MKRTNRTYTTIISIGVLSLIMMGLSMWMVQSQLSPGDLTPIAEDIASRQPVEGSEFALLPCKDEWKRGIQVKYNPPASVLEMDEKGRKDQAMLLGVYILQHEKLPTYEKPGMPPRKPTYVIVKMMEACGFMGWSQEERAEYTVTRGNIQDRERKIIFQVIREVKKLRGRMNVTFEYTGENPPTISAQTRLEKIDKGTARRTAESIFKYSTFPVELVKIYNRPPGRGKQTDRKLALELTREEYKKSLEKKKSAKPGEKPEDE